VIAVVDYKAGNLASVMKALRAVGAQVTLTEDPEVARRAQKVVLPGVGHFAATSRLDETGMTEAVREIIAKGVPFLGICVGMQWLLEGSTEAPLQPGLGHFKGMCERFPEGTEKVPHVGWNHILTRTSPPSRLFAGMEHEQTHLVYFTHSYFVPKSTLYVSSRSDPGGPQIANPTAALTTYVQRSAFVSAVEHENVMGVQFHPEKSGVAGLRILRNFVEMPC
jgi:glutamine amidotransferase